MTIPSGIIIRNVWNLDSLFRRQHDCSFARRQILDNMRISDKRYEVVDLSSGYTLILDVGTVGIGAPFRMLSSGVWPRSVKRCWNKSYLIQCQLISHDGQDLPTRFPAVGCTVALSECAHHGFVDWTACGFLSVSLYGPFYDARGIDCLKEKTSIIWSYVLQKCR